MKLIRTMAGRKPRVERERGMQVNLFRWAAAQECVLPRLKLLFAVPNGGARPAVMKDGRRFSVAAARMKAEGVKRGVPDICLPVPMGGFCGLWIEMKAGDNPASPEQRAWMSALAAEGACVHVVRDEWLHAKALIEDYLAGRLRRTKPNINAVP
jgi:hypothetical protein